jgi:hypothetical protein
LQDFQNYPKKKNKLIAQGILFNPSQAITLLKTIGIQMKKYRNYTMNL